MWCAVCTPQRSLDGSGWPAPVALLMRARKKEEAAALVRDHLLKLQKLYLTEVAAKKARSK